MGLEKKMTFKKIALMGVLAASLGALVATSVPATAAKKRNSERWYDYSTREWKTGPRRVRRHVSNKSPIRKRRVRIDKKYSPNTIIIDTS